MDSRAADATAYNAGGSAGGGSITNTQIKNYDSFVAEFFTKVFSGIKPTPEEEKKLQRIFKEKNIVSLQK